MSNCDSGGVVSSGSDNCAGIVEELLRNVALANANYQALNSNPPITTNNDYIPPPPPPPIIVNIDPYNPAVQLTQKQMTAMAAKRLLYKLPDMKTIATTDSKWSANSDGTNYVKPNWLSQILAEEPAWHNILDIRVHGVSEGGLTIPDLYNDSNMSIYGKWPDLTTTMRSYFLKLEDLDYIESQGKLQPYYYINCLSWPSDQFTTPSVSAWVGKVNAYNYTLNPDTTVETYNHANNDGHNPNYSWQPTKARVSWTPANIPIKVYFWDDIFNDVGPDSAITFTGGHAEFDLTWTQPAYSWSRGVIYYIGVEAVDKPSGPDTPIKITQFECFGLNPANYWQIGKNA